MQITIAIIISLYGLLIGSFLNVLIYRLPRKENFIMSRSYCPKCCHQLTARDLIPLFSYLFAGGKCRYCKQPISIRYPLIELLNGVIYLLIYLRIGLSAYALLNMILCSTIIVIAFIDFDTKKIYNTSNIAIMLLAIIKLVVVDTSLHRFVATILFAIIVCSLLGIMSLLFKKMLIGMGDIKYILAISLYFSLNQFIILLLTTFIVAGVFAITALLMGRLKVKDSIAFGPFLAVSSIFVILFYSDKVLSMLTWS